MGNAFGNIPIHYLVALSILTNLGNMIMKKAGGGNGILAKLFQILKNDAVKMLHSMWQLIWKILQWSQDWKRSVFIPVSKTKMPKKA